MRVLFPAVRTKLRDSLSKPSFRNQIFDAKDHILLLDRSTNPTGLGIFPLGIVAFIHPMTFDYISVEDQKMKIPSCSLQYLSDNLCSQMCGYPQVHLGTLVFIQITAVTYCHFASLMPLVGFFIWNGVDEFRVKEHAS